MKPTLVTALLVSACVPASAPAHDNTFAANARILDEAGVTTKGTLPKSLEVPAPTAEGFRLFARTHPPMWNRVMVYDGIADGQICFQEFETEAARSDVAEDLGRRNLENAEIRIEVLTELPTARPLWPSTGSPLAFKAVAEDKVDERDGAPRRYVSWRECGPVPTIPPDARYLAAIVHHPRPIGNYPAEELLLWELK